MWNYSVEQTQSAGHWYEVLWDLMGDLPAFPVYIVRLNITDTGFVQYWFIFDGDTTATVPDYSIAREQDTNIVGTSTGVYSANYISGNTDNVTIYMTTPSLQLGTFASGSATDAEYTGVYNDFYVDPTFVEGLFHDARTKFDAQYPPHMDVDMYTQPPMVTILWDNLADYPPDMYPASYYVRIKAQDINNAYAPRTIALCPYTAKEFKIDWRDILNYFPAESREQIVIDGHIFIDVQLGYLDSSYTSDPDHFVEVNHCIFDLDISDGTVTVEDSGDGNTVTPHSDSSPETDDEYDSDDGIIATEESGLNLSVDNLLTSSFKVTESDLSAIAYYLWNNNLQGQIYENQVAPMENIISCKRIPFDVDVQTPTPNIYLGNCDTGVAAHRTDATHVFDVGEKEIPTYCGNFLDFSNNISIYLPYCGIHAIPTGLCYKQDKNSSGLPVLKGRTLHVTYYYDIVYGSCAAELKMDGATFAVFTGQCGIDIPMTGSNRASVQLAMDKAADNMALGVTCTIANAGLSMLGSAAGGNGAGALATGAGAAVDIYRQTAQYEIEKSHQQLHYTTSGGFSSQIASYLSASVVLFIDHALYTEPDTYKHENGYPCNLSLNLGKLKGYTELDGSIEISDISCLDEERALLKEALCEGFYMQKDPDPTLP